MPRDRPVSLPLFRDTIRKQRRGVAQSGSASALGAEGRGFESLRPDHSFSTTYWITSRSPMADWGDFWGEGFGSLFSRLICSSKFMSKVRTAFRFA
jgi:hypothetical protein